MISYTQRQLQDKLSMIHFLLTIYIYLFVYLNIYLLIFYFIWFVATDDSTERRYRVSNGAILSHKSILFERTEDNCTNCTNVSSILLSVGDNIFSTKVDVKHLPCFSLRSIVVDVLAKAK